MQAKTMHCINEFIVDITPLYNAFFCLHPLPKPKVGPSNDRMAPIQIGLYNLPFVMACVKSNPMQHGCIRIRISFIG